MKSIPRLAAASLLLALAALPAAAEKAPRRLVVAVEAKGSAYTAAELLQLSRSLMAALEKAGTQILLLDWGPDPFPADKPEAAETIRRTADCWLLVTIGGARQNPALSVRSYDLLAKKTTIDATVPLNAAFDLPSPPAATWQKVVSAVAATYPPLDATQQAATSPAGRPALWTKQTAVLTLHAVPGTVVEGIDNDPHTIGEDGTFRQTVRSPATYQLKASKPGWLSLETRVYLEDDREITLDQHALARWSIDAGLYTMSFPQVEGSYFLVPGWMYVRAGLMTYLAGLAFSSEDIFWSEPLTTFSARVGTYAFFPQESPFRIYLAAGALLRIAHPLGSPPIYLDQAAPVAFQLSLGIEVSPWPRSRFFLEWLPTEYLCKYPDLLASSMAWVPDSMVFLPYAVLDMGGFRMGWRWML